MEKIDTRIVALFDRCTTLIQRRAWLPLNTLIMGTQCLFWASAAMDLMDRNGIDWYFCLLAATGLSFDFVSWRHAHSYWENHRKAQELNARVLYYRDGWRFRLAAAGLVVSIALLIDLVLWRLAGLLRDIVLVGLTYLHCCRYLGPGDFAREKRESLSGVPQAG